MLDDWLAISFTHSFELPYSHSWHFFANLAVVTGRAGWIYYVPVRLMYLKSSFHRSERGLKGKLLLHSSCGYVQMPSKGGSFISWKLGQS